MLGLRIVKPSGDARARSEEGRSLVSFVAHLVSHGDKDGPRLVADAPARHEPQPARGNPIRDCGSARLNEAPRCSAASVERKT